MRLAGLLQPIRLLQVVVCLSACVAAASAWAQTEVRKTLPERSGPRLRAAQTEVKKTLPGQALQAVEPPAKPTWSAEVEERGVSCNRCAGHRRRAAHALFPAPVRGDCLSALHPRRALPPDHRHARRRVPPAQGGRTARAGADPGLSLRPVRGRQVAHRHRHDRTGTHRAGHHRQAVRHQGGDPQYRSGPDGCGELRRATRRPHRVRPRADAPEAANKARPGAKPIIVIDAGHGGVDPGAAAAR